MVFLKQMLIELELKSTKQLTEGFIERDKKVSDKWGLLKTFNTSSEFLIGDRNCELINCISKSYKDFFHYIEKNPVCLCEQLCLFNFKNTNEVFLSELVDNNWTKDNKFFLSPNLLYIGEVFDRLSKLLAFYMLSEFNKKKAVKRIENVIKLVEILIGQRNFNSAYAAFCALTNLWLSKVWCVSKIKLSSKATKSYAKA